MEGSTSVEGVELNNGSSTKAETLSFWCCSKEVLITFERKYGDGSYAISLESPFQELSNVGLTVKTASFVLKICRKIETRREFDNNGDLSCWGPSQLAKGNAVQGTRVVTDWSVASTTWNMSGRIWKELEGTGVGASIKTRKK